MQFQSNIRADQVWSRIETVVEIIFTPEGRSLTFEQYMNCYTEISNFCVIPNSTENNVTVSGGELYYLLRRFVEKYLSKLVADCSQHKEEALLKYYADNWIQYAQSAKILHNLFMYINRMWIKRTMDDNVHDVADINTTCLQLWNRHFFSELSERLLPTLLQLILKDRLGNTVDRTMIQTITMSFVTFGISPQNPRETNLDIYKASFESKFIEATREFYIAESEAYISSNPITEYMKKAVIWLEEEEARVNNYLHSSTRELLIKAAEIVLLLDHAKALQDEFKPLLERDKIEDLQRIFSLLSRVPETLPKLRDIFEEHVKQQGLLEMEKISATESANNSGMDTPQEGKKKTIELDPKVYVETLLTVYLKFEQISKTGFNSEAGFVASLDRGCRDFVNRNIFCKNRSSRSSELLAKYVDGLLRKSSKTTEDSEVENLLNGVMTIFKFIEDKDVFQKFYTKNLAKRLVNSMSASDDAEASMISKLKEACGFEYISKLQRMFTDISVSKDLNNDYTYLILTRTRQIESRGKTDLDYSILILCSGSWPLTAPTTPFNIPETLLPSYERFTAYYQNKHQGRKLVWLIQLSKGELKTSYLKGNYLFQVSTYQIGLLLPYNNSTSYSKQELQQITGMSDDSLTGNLGLLCKAKVLVENGDRYDLNMDFRSKKTRINLNIAIKSEQKAEIEETHKTIEKDRELVIQAAIVRIMKARKALKHVQLMQEVIAQLQTRFKPQVQDIKKCIDILLEKEYIERMEDQRDMYSYVA